MHARGAHMRVRQRYAGKAQQEWDRLEATLLGYTRYDKVVEAFGGHGEYVERPEELRPALERAAASGKPALVNVIIRQDREYRGGTYV